MKQIVATLARLVPPDEGQDLIEYGLLVALIAVVAIAGVASLGVAVNSVLWQTIAQNF